MKTGKTLTEMGVELDRQLNTRKDYIAPTSKIEMEARPAMKSDEKPYLVMTGVNGHAFGFTDHAHGQFASYTGIPKQYYDRMRSETPGLLATNVNEWLHRKPEPRMLRTLDGKVRAVLSSKYRPLDNHDLAQVALPIMIEKGCQIVSAELTETRMYIKATLPSLQTEIKSSRAKGDIVQAGIVLSNSEVGAGAVRIEPLIYRLVCLNGMIAPDASLRKFHIGKGADGEGVREFLTTETRTADDRAFWLKVRDLVRAAFEETTFRALVDRIEQAASEKIASVHLEKVVEVTTSRMALPDGMRSPILRNLIEGADLSRWGMVNAVTAVANGSDDYELATDLERAGGRILELPKSDWSVISEAA